MPVVTLYIVLIGLLSVLLIQCASLRIPRTLKMAGFDLNSALLAPNAPKITDFDRKVYEACSKIPPGKVSTYKEIAQAIGRAGAFRAVGSSLRKNPFAPQVPCHRVVASDLSLGGFHGSKDPRGDMLRKKVNMLATEGVSFERSNKIKMMTEESEPKVVKSMQNKRKRGADSSNAMGADNDDSAADTSRVRVDTGSVFRF